MIAVQQGDEGRLIGDFALKFDHPDLLDDVRAAIRDGTTREVEIVRREDARVFMLRIAPYRTPEQAIEGAVLTFVDISPMKEAQKQLLTYRQRAEVAIAACGGGLYEHSVPPGPDTYYNERWAEILGYSRAELPDAREFLDWLFERIEPEDRESLEKAYRAFSRGKVDRYDVQVRLRHKGGHWVWVRGVCQPVARDPNGRATRVAGLMFDVTAEHEANEQLQEAVARLRLALDAGGMGIWGWDPGQQKVFWDERTYELLGLDPAKTQPSLERLLAAVHPEDRDELRQVIDGAVASGERYSAEFRVALPDGRTRRLGLQGQVQRSENGRAARMIGVVFDTTARRRRGDRPEPSAPAPDPRAAGETAAPGPPGLSGARLGD